jgi:hypothetical protein
MKHARFHLIPILLVCAACAACAAKRPVLYPNQHYRQVGIEISQIDIDACMQMAETGVGDKNRAAETAGSTAVGAGGGAAVGAVGGAITGNAGTGAAVGAATGGTVGLMRGLFGSRQRDPIFMAYVETCLREKGYQPLGWK